MLKNCRKNEIVHDEVCEMKLVQVDESQEWTCYSNVGLKIHLRRYGDAIGQGGIASPCPQCHLT